MYRINQSPEMTFDFALPFGGQLRRDNRLVILADLIPWDQVEDQYAKLFEDSGTGCPGSLLAWP